MVVEWSHSSKQLPALTVGDFTWESNEQVTEVCKRVFGAGNSERRLYFSQLAGGHWDVKKQVFVRGRHPYGILLTLAACPSEWRKK